MKLVVITTKEAQWVGMAPSVAGGWVMNEPVACMALDIEGVTQWDEHLALVPDSFAAGGRIVESADVLSALGSALDRTQRRDWGVHRRNNDAEALRTWIKRVESIASN